MFAGAREDVASSALVIDSGGHHHEMIRRATTFYSGENWLKVGDRFELLNVPDDAQVGFWRDQLTIELRSDWAIGGNVHPGGALLAIAVADFLAGQRAFATLYTPGPRKSLSGLAGLESALIVNELDNVRSRLYLLKPGRDGWTRTPIEAPAFGALGVSAIDDDSSDDYWLTVTDFLTPTTLYRASLGGGAAQRLKALPPFFDAGGLDIVQHEVTSKDGTRVPYFQVSRKGLKLDGSNPTLLYGYGGFEVSMLPSYSASVGASWMGEYGNPDIPEEWAWIAKYSPYQNLKPDAKYPRVLFTTSTRDDRVHPGHARKMAARMAQQGHDVLYYENIEGGHGGAANNPQLARMGALAYAFLWQQLK